jgi:hypothetical protein
LLLVIIIPVGVIFLEVAFPKPTVMPRAAEVAASLGNGNDPSVRYGRLTS